MMIFLLLTISVFSCNTTEPPEIKNITLSVEDVSCTEAWLKVTSESISGEVIITRDENEVKRLNATNSDTIVYIDSLLPNQTYTLQALLTQNGNITGRSEKVTATTMDTTSHNFTFETFTFGGGGEASFINDVAVIDENNVWACGEIYLPDSLGNPDDVPHNLIHWDGMNWTPQKITVNFRGFLITPSLYGIFAFPQNQIWLAGGLTIYGDGKNWTPYDVRRITGFDTLFLQKCWGVNPSEMYFVGMTGAMASFKNGSWQRIESGTRDYINDVWGIVNDNNETIAYCPVSSFFTPGDKKILRIKNNRVDSVSWNMNKLLYSAWTNSERYLYVCGSGVFENKSGNWKEINITSVASNRIRGNHINNIFVIGDFGFAAHFNGINWKSFDNLFDFNSGFRGISVKENMVAIAGRNNGNGIIIIGRRN